MSNIETRTYCDGTTATGPAPLPALSPVQQWRVCNVRDTMVLDADGNEVALMMGNYETDYVRMAERAELIAAVPLILQTLRDMDGWLANTGHAETHPWRISLRAAVGAAQ